MRLGVKWVLALASACGIAVSTLLYIKSFYRTSIGESLLWTSIILGVGAVAVSGPLYILEYPASRSYRLKAFKRQLPTWFAPSSNLLWLVVLGHFLWFAAHSGAGVPGTKDGQYVIITRGKVLKILSQTEYCELKGAETRMFLSLVISIYFVPMIYWWPDKGKGD
jgi:hypothetical protein